MPGYFAADGNAANSGTTSCNKWHAHFAPDKTGRWEWSVSFFAGKAVAFDAAAVNSATPVTPVDGMRTPPAMTAPPAVTTAPLVPSGSRTPRGAEWGFLYVLDVDGAGRNDVLTTSAHSYGVCWFEQLADGGWKQHIIDDSWSHAHASVLADINGDGRPDLMTGKRFQSRNVPAAGNDDPLGIYWYEFTQGANHAVTWTRHTIDYGGKAGGGLQMTLRDIDGDGDMDVVSGGKSGRSWARI